MATVSGILYSINSKLLNGVLTGELLLVRPSAKADQTGVKQGRQNATKMQPKFCEVTDALGEDDKLIRETDCGRLTDEEHTSVGTLSSILSPTVS